MRLARSATQQLAAITAPLEPAVVIAGAGSGKTTVMAARVVWLVATGQVAPDQVLGLTFTTKAAAELADRGSATASRQAGLLPERAAPGAGDDEPEEVEEPTVATYHAYAAALLTEHGLRIGHEPDTRVIADATPLPARRPRGRSATPARSTSSPTRPATSSSTCSPSTRELSEHLVDPDDGPRLTTPRERPLFVDGMADEHRKTYRETNEKAIAAIDKRAELLGLVEAYRGLKAHLGLMDFSDQIALAARLADDASRGRRGRARQVPGRAARRVPGHLGRPGADAEPAVLRPGRRARPRPPGHRGRRPQPGDLRLARRLGLQHPRASAATSRPPTARGPTYPLTRQPALRRADPRRPPTTSPPTLYDAPPERAAARGQAGRGRRRGAARSCTRPTTTSWPGSPTEVIATPRRDGRAAPGARSACSTRDNAHAAAVFDALTRPRDPGRDRRPQGPAAAARGRPRWSRRSPCSRTSPPTPRC